MFDAPALLERWVSLQGGTQGWSGLLVKSSQLFLCRFARREYSIRREEPSCSRHAL